MIIKQKVTSLSLSKKMKELGWKYSTEKYWCKCDIKNSKFKIYNSMCLDFCGAIRYRAPDAIEIMDKLPNCVYVYKAADGFWDCDYKNLHGGDGIANTTQAEAMGKLWCYLKEKKLI